MSKLKDIQITIDEARELVEKFGEAHEDVRVSFNEYRASMFFFSITMRDKEIHYGLGRSFYVPDVCKDGLSSVENTLNEFYDNIVNHRKELKS